MPRTPSARQAAQLTIPFFLFDFPSLFLVGSDWYVNLPEELDEYPAPNWKSFIETPPMWIVSVT